MCCCGSELNYEACCKPVIEHRNARSSEQLMRSRYVAFKTANANYILQTQSPELSDVAEELFEQQLLKQKFIDLKVIESQEFEVYFQAKFIEEDVLYILQERSGFIFKDGHYIYDKSIDMKIDQEPLTNKMPCPCGSGKKYKHCCAKE